MQGTASLHVAWRPGLLVLLVDLVLLLLKKLECWSVEHVRNGKEYLLELCLEI